MQDSVVQIVVMEDDDSVRNAIVGYHSRHAFDVRGLCDVRGFYASCGWHSRESAVNESIFKSTILLPL